MKEAQGVTLLEKQILALHYNGVYITNFDFQKIAQNIGIELDLSDREKMLKSLLKEATQQNRNSELISELTKLLNKRVKEYQEWMDLHPNAQEMINEYIQKTRSTIMLLQHRLRMSVYE